MKNQCLKAIVVFLSLLLLLLNAADTAQITIIYVDAEATGTGTGKSWENAYPYLTDALNAAASGNTIYVAEGVYYPDQSAAIPNGTGLRTASFSLLNNVTIYGGFDPSVGVDTLAERSWKNYKTYLSGNIGDIKSASDNSYHVVKNSKDVTSTAILDGFIIAAGNANGSSLTSSGGGMTNENASPIIRNCVFSQNQASGQGAGMYNIYQSEPYLFNCEFNANTSGSGGGGMYNDGSSPELEACTFTGNQALSGAGVYNNGSSPVLTGTVFTDNSAGYGGGAVYNYNASAPVFYNCIFSENFAAYDGGAIHNAYNSSSLAVNCTFTGNLLDSTNSGHGGGIYNRSNSRTEIANSILWDDEPDELYPTDSFTVTYSDIETSTVFPGTGNMNVSPLLDATFHLDEDSPCIDAGSNDAVPAFLTVDFEGDGRIINGDGDDPEAVVDMGADESPFVMVTHDLAVGSSAGGSVTQPGEGIFSFDHERIVDLLAVSEGGYRFLNWSGDTGQVAGIFSAQTTITMDDSYSITANFEQDIDPDLVVTDVWEENGGICYQLHNIGEATALKGHYTRLVVNNNTAADDLVDNELPPDGRISRCFPQYIWDCTSSSDEIMVCADGAGQITESDETNNCRSESWQCDTTAPLITDPPVVSQVDPYTVDIKWDTDCDADSVVMFGTSAGVFSGQAADQQSSQNHQIRLENLAAGTTYHYRVLSTDAGGNTIESKDFFFQTAPLADTTPPVVSKLTAVKGDGAQLFYKVLAQVTDDTGVERVAFYLDGTLVGVDYLEPFEYKLAPADLGLSREDFFKAHTLTAVAVSHAGVAGMVDLPFEPAYECADINMEMQAPYPDDTYYIDYTSVPSGTTIPIRVRAAMTELDCHYFGMSGLPPGASNFFCDEIYLPVTEVRFYVNSVLIETVTPSAADEFIFEIDWDISGKTTGTYFIRVDAIVDDECRQTITNTFAIEKGEPELDVTREVTRIGNYFEIQLRLRNRGTATVTFDRLEDSVDGFQPIERSDSDYDVVPSCNNDGTHCDVEIDFAGRYYDLAAGDSKWVSYLAVPILHPPDESVDYRIGATPVRVVDYYEMHPHEFDRPCALTQDDYTLSSEVNRAIRNSDYLIITNPDKLFSTSADAAGVNSLLSAMAELASLRNAILGYLYGSDSNDTGWIKECIRTWGTPMQGMDGVDEHYLSNGYLLLVGEVEIIPSFTKTVKDKWWFITIATYHIHFTDMPYGDTNGRIDPELSVARIIGDDPSELIIPIQASINVINGEPGFEFDRSHALIVSGSGDGVSSFEGNLDDVEDILEDEFTVTKRKKRRVEDSGGNITTEFKLYDANKDHLFYRDHCNPTAWSGVIGTSDFTGSDPVDFEDAKPFAFACCCQAGQYEDDSEDAADRTNIAESFLQHGAPSYIGATENSFRGQNNSAAKWFYNHWVNTGKTVGQTFRELKVHLGDFQGDYWSYEYNLYGDPKYGGSGVAAASLASKAMTLPESPYGLVVPDYEVKSLNGEDHVSIPGGNMILAEDKPAVPYYKVSIEFPEGYAVHDVTLEERSEPITTTGLNIPLSEMGLDNSTAGSTASAAGGEEWWPPQEAVFEYQFETRPDRTSVLTITVFPFYYNGLTTDAKFYKTYTFNIDYDSGGVGIALLSTEKENYAQGEIVQADLWLTSAEDPQDVIVEVLVKEESSDEVVDGLLLRTLSQVTQTAYFALEWDSSNFPAGAYYLEANIRDSSGHLIDRRNKSISTGMASIAITDFTATPDAPYINTGLEFKNIGSVDVSGKAIIIIQDSQGAVVAEFPHDFEDLAPWGSLSFADSWDPSGASGQTYHFQAYVLYDSGCSEVRSLSVPLCLDLNEFAQSFGSASGQGHYDAAFDFDRDGDVDGKDLSVINIYSPLRTWGCE